MKLRPEEYRAFLVGFGGTAVVSCLFALLCLLAMISDSEPLAPIAKWDGVAMGLFFAVVGACCYAMLRRKPP